jgi:hypothetical protein
VRIFRTLCRRVGTFRRLESEQRSRERVYQALGARPSNHASATRPWDSGEDAIPARSGRAGVAAPLRIGWRGTIGAEAPSRSAICSGADRKNCGPQKNLTRGLLAPFGHRRGYQGAPRTSCNLRIMNPLTMGPYDRLGVLMSPGGGSEFTVRFKAVSLDHCRRALSRRSQRATLKSPGSWRIVLAHPANPILRPGSSRPCALEAHGVKGTLTGAASRALR